MRLVGPRPEAPEVLQYYSPEEMYKFTCTPGITGLAQINGRGLLNWGETLRWDLEYIRTRSVALDLKIILLTLKHVVTRRGASKTHRDQSAVPPSLVFLLQALAIVALPTVLLRYSGLKALIPLVVVQILVGISLGPSVFGRIAPE
jgi:Bacterial sugar transferase